MESYSEVVFWVLFVPFYLWLLWPVAKEDVIAWWNRKRFRSQLREIERHL